MKASQALDTGSIPVTRSRFFMIEVKKIFKKTTFFLVMIVIFFLTGCATRGYHTPLGIPVAGFPEQPFMRPLSGQTVLSFAAKEEGVSAKGIVIRAREGDMVRASRAGEVVLVDEALQGYGKTVILRHSDVFSTVYARNAEILVNLGQKVRQGEGIAKVGRAGRSGVPELYFEIRKNSKPEDPTHYF